MTGGAERVRWTQAWAGTAPREILVEFRHSPDYEPVEAVVDEQPGYVGLCLHVRPRASSGWERQSLERHVAATVLPFDLAGREVRDVRPRTPSGGVRVAARHHEAPA